MPLREKFETILAPVGGLDLRRPPTMLDPRKTPFTRNTTLQFGEVRKRFGRTQFSGSASPILFGGSGTPAIMHIDQFFRTDGTDFLLAWSTKKVGSYNSGTDDFTNRTIQVAGVDVDFTGDEDDVFTADYYPATDRFYWTNYVDSIQEWDGTTARAVNLYTAATLRARVVRTFQNHLNFYDCVDGGTVVRQRVKWTDAAVTTLTGGTSGSADLRDGSDWVLNAVQLGSKMAIYKERSIVIQEHVGGSIVYRFTTKITGIGLAAERCVADLGGEHIFLGSDLNVYRFDGGPDIVPIGDEIQSELRATVDATNGSRSFMHIVEELNEVWLCIVETGDTLPDRIYKWNFIDKTWSTDSLAHAAGAMGYYRRTSTTSWNNAAGTWDSQVARWDDRTFSTNAPTNLMGSSVGKLTEWSQNQFNDDGSTMDVIFDTPDLTSGDNYTRTFRRYFDFNFEAKGTAVDVYYSTDEGATYVLLETVTLTGNWTRYNVECDLTYQKVRFRLRNNVSNGQLNARSFEIGYVDQGIL